MSVITVPTLERIILECLLEDPGVNIWTVERDVIQALPYGSRIDDDQENSIETLVHGLRDRGLITQNLTGNLWVSPLGSIELERVPAMPQRG
jgi:hypothetical protein